IPTLLYIFLPPPPPPTPHPFPSTTLFRSARAHLAAQFNRGEGHTIVDHHTYFLASDGDLMEGASHEACSLAGHLKLGGLIGIYRSEEHTSEPRFDLVCRLLLEKKKNRVGD